MNKFFLGKIFIFSVLSFYFFIANGEVMTGTSYKMDSDSINFGGNLSTSTDYSMDDSLGESATGYSAGTLYDINAGFQQNDLSSISISVSSSIVTMSPSLGGLSGGYSNGSTILNIVTDNPAGYSLFISSENSPALISENDNFQDYSPLGPSPDYDFGVDNTESLFGYSVYGDDINDRYKNDGSSACGTGSTITSLKCWDGLSTTQKLIAGRSSRNDPLGTDTTINLRAGVGPSRVQKNGWYYATTTITAVAL